MIWKPQQQGCEYAYAGKHIIGMVVPLSDGSGVVWHINDVVGSKYQRATRGECQSVAGEKRAFRRAWLNWLTERGLCEAVAVLEADIGG